VPLKSGGIGSANLIEAVVGTVFPITAFFVRRSIGNRKLVSCDAAIRSDPRLEFS
jgi:hypothetical protein